MNHIMKRDTPSIDACGGVPLAESLADRAKDIVA
jgi:hypothetical protein